MGLQRHRPALPHGLCQFTPPDGALHIFIARLKVLKVSCSQKKSDLYFPEGPSGITQHCEPITISAPVPTRSAFSPIRGCALQSTAHASTCVPRPVHLDAQDPQSSPLTPQQRAVHVASHPRTPLSDTPGVACLCPSFPFFASKFFGISIQ